MVNTGPFTAGEHSTVMVGTGNNSSKFDLKHELDKFHDQFTDLRNLVRITYTTRSRRMM